MDVDIDVFGRDLNAQIDRGAVTRMDRCTIAGLGRPHEEWILEGTPVDEELGPSSSRLRIARPLHVAVDPERTGGVFHRHQGPREVAAPHRSEPLGGILTWGHCESAGAVHVQLEAGLRMRQGQRGDGLVRRAGLTRR